MAKLPTFEEIGSTALPAFEDIAPLAPDPELEEQRRGFVLDQSEKTGISPAKLQRRQTLINQLFSDEDYEEAITSRKEEYANAGAAGIWMEFIDAEAQMSAKIGAAFKRAHAALVRFNPLGEPTAQEKATLEARAKRYEEQAGLLWEVSKNPDVSAEGEGGFHKAARLTGGTVPYITATTLAYTVAGPLGGFAVGGLVEGHSAYQEAIDARVEETTARNIGLGVGIVNGAIESIGGKFTEEFFEKIIKKRVTAKIKQAGALFGLGTLVEALEEGSQEVATITGEEVYRDVNWKERLTRVAASMAGGAFLGGTMRGMQIAGKRLAQERSETPELKQELTAAIQEQTGLPQEEAENIAQDTIDDKFHPEQETAELPAQAIEKAPSVPVAGQAAETGAIEPVAAGVATAEAGPGAEGNLWYHGTPSETLNFGKAPKGNEIPFGVHFTQDKALAQDFASGATKGKPTGKPGRIVEAELNITNPLDVQKGVYVEGTKEYEVLKEIANRSGITEAIRPFKDGQFVGRATYIDGRVEKFPEGTINAINPKEVLNNAKLSDIKAVLKENGYDQAIKYSMFGTKDPLGIGAPVYTPAIAILDKNLITPSVQPVPAADLSAVRVAERPAERQANRFEGVPTATKEILLKQFYQERGEWITDADKITVYEEFKQSFTPEEAKDFKAVTGIIDKEIAHDLKVKPTEPSQEALGKGEGEKAEGAEPVAKPLEKGPERKVSRAAQRVQEEAIAKDLTESLGELPTYETMSMQEQARMASEEIDKDYENAKKMAYGKVAPPSGLRPASIYRAVAVKARNEADVETLRNLAVVHPQISLELTAMGQAIKAADVGTMADPVKAMQDIQKAKEKAVAKRKKIKDIPGQKRKMVKEAKTEIHKAVTHRQSWNSFVESIRC